MQKYGKLIGIGLVLGLLTFIAVTLYSDTSQLVKAALVFPWLIMIPVLALRVVNWAIRFGKWYFYVRVVGVHNLKLSDALITFLSGLAMAASPGKIAEVLKAFIIRNMTGAPVATTLPTIAAERLSDGIAVLLLSVGSAAIVEPKYMPAAFGALALITVGIIILAIRPLCLAFLNGLSRVPVVGRYIGHFRAFYESSYKIVQLPNLIIGVGTGLVANTLDGVGVFLILIALGRPATTETFFWALLAISFSVVTGSVSGLPSGVGASDLTITGVLLLAGLSKPEAGFATLLARFVQSWWGVLVGLIVAALFRKRLFPPSLERIIEAEQAGTQQTVTA